MSRAGRPRTPDTPVGAVGAAREAERVVDQLLGEARAQLEDVRAAHATFRREQEHRAGERAALARAGLLGPSTRVLQEEVDAARTTWSAILDGTDPSPGAARARSDAAAVVAAVRAGRRSRAPR